MLEKIRYALFRHGQKYQGKTVIQFEQMQQSDPVGDCFRTEPSGDWVVVSDVGYRLHRSAGGCGVSHDARDLLADQRMRIVPCIAVFKVENHMPVAEPA